MLTPNLLHIIAQLDELISSKSYPAHAVDVFNAIKDCIITSSPIPIELQEQYVCIVANDQRQNRYGK